MKQVVWFGWVLAGALIVGCGSKSAGSGTLMTSVPADKPIDTLSAADVSGLCADTNAYIRASLSGGSLKAGLCRADGLAAAAQTAGDATATDAQLGAACTSAESNCLSASADPPVLPATGCERAQANCTASVGEYSACVMAVLAQVDQFLASLPACAGLTRSGLEAANQGGGNLSQAPAACQTYQAHCPGTGLVRNLQGLFGASSSGTTDGGG
jgi:hypothetical protein